MDRKALGRALAALGEGDVLLVTRLDRLARSTRDLLNVLVGKAGAGFRSLADAWADTTTPHGRLMITILGGLAEFERSLILARTTEGRVRAENWLLPRWTSLREHHCPQALKRSSNVAWYAGPITQRSSTKAAMSEVKVPRRSCISSPVLHCRRPCWRTRSKASSARFNIPARSARSLVVRFGSSLPRKLCVMRKVKNRPARAPLSS
jgi:hypothetical protein